MTRTLRLPALALCVAGAFASPAQRASAVDDDAVIDAAIGRVHARHGVAHGSLVVIPLVVDEDDAAPAGLTDSADGVAWALADGSARFVDVSAPLPGASPAERLLRAGTLLLGGADERVLERPLPLADGEKAHVPSAVCDARTQPDPAAAAGAPRIGPLAPLEQRKLLVIGEDGVLPVALRVQALLAGASGVRSVTELLAAPRVGEGVAARRPQLDRVPGAYAGRATGHVVFFGMRPVEVVLCARPALYRLLAPSYLQSTAVSHTLWCELIAGGPPEADDATVRLLVEQADKVMRGLVRAHFRAAARVPGANARFRLLGADADAEDRDRWRHEPFACRATLDDDHAFVLLEAYEDGPEAVFPQPYREPGGRPVGEPPSNKGNGPLTPMAMERLLERIRERRGER